MWRLVVIFWGLCSIVSAQNHTIKAVEWSIEPNYSSAKISAKAFITLSQPVKDSIIFSLKAEKILDVRLWQGRLKQKLPYKYSYGKISVKADGFSSLYLEYIIDVKDEGHLMGSSIDQNGIALNTSAAGGLESIPQAGLWYPENHIQTHPVKFNVLLPAKWEVRMPWPEQYTVKDGPQTAHFFERSTGSLDPFFLLAGDFAKMQLPELMEEVQLSYSERTEVFGEQLKTQHSEFLKYAQLTGISNKEIYLADSIASQTIQKIYPLTLDFYNDPKNKLYQTLLLKNHDSLVASLLLYRFLNRNTEPSIIAEELATDSFSNPQLFVWLNYYLRDYNTSLADTSSASLANTSAKAPLRIAQHVWEKKQIPQITLNYRYLNGLMNIYVQKDSLLKGTNLPLEISYVINKQRTNERYITDEKLKDTVSISSNGSPYLIYATKPALAPLKINNNLPDNYWLYLLANGSDTEKREALEALFKTTNVNLKATVIGIALDDTDPRIRVKALENAGDLNVMGQKRLESTLKTLQTEDPNPQVQDLAKEWVEKYYTL